MLKPGQTCITTGDTKQARCRQQNFRRRSTLKALWGDPLRLVLISYYKRMENRRTG
jgi:hypothetical protein